MLISVIVGMCGGAGFVCALLAVTPSAPIDLTAAVARLHHRGNVPAQSPARPARLLEAVTCRAVRAQHPWFRLPHADLALLNRTPRSYIAQRGRWAASALSAAIVITVVLPMPVAASVVVVLVAAPVGSLLPAWRIHEVAVASRDDARRALAVYLDLVAQERAAGRGPAHALRDAAEMSPHWTFAQLGATVSYAQRTGVTPWQELAKLGHRWQLDELIQVADLASTAADGAAIHTALTTQAAGLRQAVASAEHAEANSRSERLTLPATLLMLGFLMLVLYPTVERLLNF